MKLLKIKIMVMHALIILEAKASLKYYITQFSWGVMVSKKEYPGGAGYSFKLKYSHG